MRSDLIEDAVRALGDRSRWTMRRDGIMECTECRSRAGIGHEASCPWKRLDDALRAPMDAAVIPDNAHKSDCAVHNAPALPVGPCDCGAVLPALPKYLDDAIDRLVSCVVMDEVHGTQFTRADMAAARAGLHFDILRFARERSIEDDDEARAQRKRDECIGAYGKPSDGPKPTPNG